MKVLIVDSEGHETVLTEAECNSLRIALRGELALMRHPAATMCSTHRGNVARVIDLVEEDQRSVLAA